MFGSWAGVHQLLTTFFTYTVCASVSIGAGPGDALVPRPRGVSLSRAGLYDATRPFSCFDQSGTFPFAYVNDDYCHCADGSDEPGTAACPMAVFYCMNKGHKPRTIPSMLVNDMVCDCCDGTDEYAPYAANCSDTCRQLNEMSLAEANRKAEIAKLGVETKNEYITKGTTFREQQKHRLEELNQIKSEAEQLKDEKQTLKNSADKYKNEALEKYQQQRDEEARKQREMEQQQSVADATEVFTRFDSNQDGFVDLDELQTRQMFDADRNGEVSTDEAKSVLNQLEKVDLETFIRDAWNNVKPLLMLESGVYQPPSKHEEDESKDVIPEESEQEPEPSLNEGKFGDDGDDDHDANNDDGADPDIPEEDDIDSNVNNEPIYDADTQQLIDAANEVNKQFDEANSKVNSIHNEINSIEKYLTMDFGVDDEFAVLNGQCFEFTDHTYTFKLCPFQKVEQQTKDGGANILLGSWGRWTGPEHDKYANQLYENGHICGDGPHRKAIIGLTCSNNNSVTSVKEPSRCEYVVEFATPAACKDPPPDYETLHDEL